MVSTGSGVATYKCARTSVSRREASVGWISFSYLMKDGRKFVTFRDDTHRLGLSDPPDFLQVMREVVGFTRSKVFSDLIFKKSMGKTQSYDYIFLGFNPRRRSGSEGIDAVVAT